MITCFCGQQFSPNGFQLGVGTEVGQIDILDRGKKWQSSKIWQAHQNAIYDIKWMNGGEKIVSVAGDNNLCVWDVGLHKCLATARPPKVKTLLVVHIFENSCKKVLLIL